MPRSIVPRVGAKVASTDQGTMPISARRMAHTCFFVILVWVMFPTSLAHAGECPSDRDEPFIDVTLPDGTGLVGEMIRVETGAVRLAFGGWSACPVEKHVLSATAVLSLHSPSGVTRRLAVKDGAAEFTPAQLGVYRLSVEATLEGKETLRTTKKILIVRGNMEFVLPKIRKDQLRKGYHRVLHFSHWIGKASASPGQPGKWSGMLQRHSKGRIRLPRVAGYWRAPLRRGDLWIEADSDRALPTIADSLVEFVPSTPLARNQRLLLRVRGKGIPERLLGCARGCSLFVPRGTSIVEVDFGDGNTSEIALKSRGRYTKHILPVPPLLATIAKAEWAAGLRGVPRSAVPSSRGSCKDGEPVSLGKLQYRIGSSSLCLLRSGKWVMHATRPTQHDPTTKTTHAVPDGGQLFFAETKGRDSISLVVAGPDGFAHEWVRVDQEYRSCKVNEVAVDGETIAAVGGCTRDPNGPKAGVGFIVIRGPLGTRVIESKIPLQHVAKFRTGFVASDSDGNILRCRKHCRRKRLWGVQAIAGFVSLDKTLFVVETRGSLHPVKGGNGPAIAAPSWNLRISRVVQTASGAVIALFGPETVGSEYHPYCVGSRVAALGSRDWMSLHHVGDPKPGRRLDCQNDDSSPPVVIDIATAGGTLYARRRFHSQKTTSFAPLLGPGGGAIAIP